jgi:ComF family protein
MALWLEHLLQIIFPNLCLVCGESLASGEENVCIGCLSGISYTGFHLRPDNPVEQRFWGKVKIEHATSLFYFQKATVTQHLLHALKYKGEKQVGIMMGRTLGDALNNSDAFAGVDVVVPVPLHRKKQRRRGFNQSEIIADGIISVFNKPMDTIHLQRSVENTTQTRKGVYERWKNTSDIFHVTDLSAFENKHVLLIDDVLTTGATIEACAKAILQAAGARVSVATLGVA